MANFYDPEKTEVSLEQVENVVAQGPFNSNWSSLRGYRVPDWYISGKFGIFIHWGVYSVPAFGNEWYPRQMYQQGSDAYTHHVATYGPHKKFGYKDFIPRFTMHDFDASDWARLFAQTGAKFVVPVAEHHDGFAMYDSELSDWTAAKMGPQRDVVGQLAEAVRAEGLVFGVSSHRAEHNWFFDGGTTFDSDVQDPANAGLYGPAATAPKDLSSLYQAPPSKAFLDDWLARTCELVDKYQPQLVWFDWWIQHDAFKPYLQRFAAYYYNRAAEWQKGVAINHKYEAFPEGTAVFDIERGQVSELHEGFWQNDTSVARNSWGYTENQDYKDVVSIIHDLVDVVSKNGALLLNIGPKADGTIPEPERAMLREIGAWLTTNGEAIYDTEPWETFGEGPTTVPEGAFSDTKRNAFTSRDIRFTAKPGILYATVMAWPEAALTMSSLKEGSGLRAEAIAEVKLLGQPGALSWTQDDKGLHLELPDKPFGEHAYVFKIMLKD